MSFAVCEYQYGVWYTIPSPRPPTGPPRPAPDVPAPLLMVGCCRAWACGQANTRLVLRKHRLVGVEKTPLSCSATWGKEALRAPPTGHPAARPPVARGPRPLHLVVVSFDLVPNALRHHRRPAALPYVEPSGVAGPLDPCPRASARRPVDTGAAALMRAGPGRSPA